MEVPVNIFFFQWVREEKLKMSRRELAKLIDVHFSTIRNWEIGKTNPTSESLKLVAAKANIDVNAFFEPTHKKVRKDFEQIFFRWFDCAKSRDLQDELTINDLLRIGDFLGFRVAPTQKVEVTDERSPREPTEVELKLMETLNNGLSKSQTTTPSEQTD